MRIYKILMDRWHKANRLIPGGNSLLSKRPNLFSPNKWPTYYERAKGCHVWDLSGKKYLDMSIMGIGPSTLGYANDEVDNRVINAIKKGNMSTLNAYEEVELAERLVDLHCWADMAKFARSGGEANSISIRIARASTGKEIILFCGYHGWHDWYLSSELGGRNLKDHLFEDTGVEGVPKSLEGTSIPFTWNDIEGLKRLVDVHRGKIAAIKMEVTRNILPVDGFLREIREICNKEGIVLIFDECTSGFRETFGGIHLKYGVNPDLAVFGKALGNGFAITAVLGRKEIMMSAKKTFISSTFWSERTGFVAALATLDEMERLESWKLISKIGQEVQRIWRLAADSFGIEIKLGVIPAISTFDFCNTGRSREYRSYFTQHLLSRNILGGTLFFASTAHAKEDLQNYSVAVCEAFEKIRDRENGVIGQLVRDDEMIGSTFKRLN